MPRRLALENLPGNVCLSNTLIFMQLRTLSRNGAHSTPLLSVVCALFPMQRRGRGPWPFAPNRYKSSKSRATKPFRMCTYDQTPRFARFWPKLCARNPFRIRTCKNPACNSFGTGTYEKRWGEGRRRSLRLCVSLIHFACLGISSTIKAHVTQTTRSRRRLASFFSSTYNLGLRTRYSFL